MQLRMPAPLPCQLEHSCGHAHLAGSSCVCAGQAQPRQVVFVANDWPCGVLPLYVRSLQAPAVAEAQHAAPRQQQPPQHHQAPAQALHAATHKAGRVDAEGLLEAVQHATAGGAAPSAAARSTAGPAHRAAHLHGATQAHAGASADDETSASAFAAFAETSGAFARELTEHEHLLRRRLADAKVRDAHFVALASEPSTYE